jgi:hypothetical protein
MAFFGSDNYPGDLRSRQLMERTFRRRQIETIAIAAFVSAAVTTAIGLSVLGLRAPRPADAPPTIVETHDGCAVNCKSTTPRLDAQLVQEALPLADAPTSVDPAKVTNRSNDALPQINLVTVEAAKTGDTERSADRRDAEPMRAVGERGSDDADHS